MKTIPLTRGKVTIVDDADFAWLSSFTWICTSVGYAFNRRLGYMQRVLLGAKRGEQSDHINGDRLDNRRENLRLATHRENMRNKRKNHPGATSRFKGVSFDRRDGRWVAFLCLPRGACGAGKSRRSLGRCDSEETAATYHDAAALALHGEFACINGILTQHRTAAKRCLLTDEQAAAARAILATATPNAPPRTPPYLVTCGSPAMFQRGCRCEACKSAQSAYRKQRRIARAMARAQKKQEAA